MEENAYLTSIVASAVYLTAGFRLLRLSRRTRERPELLLGLYFTLSGVYYLGFNIPSLLGFDALPEQVSVAIEWVYMFGVFPYLFFIRSVFRSKAAWGGWVVWICSAVLVAGTLMLTVDGSVEYSLGNPGYIAAWVGYTTPSVWMCWEATLHRRSAQKRAQLGLVPPIVVNRYLLLALFGGFQFLASLSDLSFAYDISSNQAASAVSHLLLGGTEAASVVMLWLAFFPPRVYQNWIEGRAMTQPAPTEG